MPLWTINDLKAALKGNGAKNDKYYIEIAGPIGVPGLTFEEADIMLCKATSFPARNIGEVDAWVQGRKLKMPGDSTFDNTWNCTFYQTHKHELRMKFLKWVNAIDTYIDNKHTDTPFDMMVDCKVHQVNNQGKEIATYVLYNCFPSQVGEVQIGADQINQIEEFVVDFTFSHWEEIPQ